jgi:hypothetical protein
MLGVPSFGFVGVIAEEEDAADTGDFGWEGHEGARFQRALAVLGYVFSFLL